MNIEEGKRRRCENRKYRLCTLSFRLSLSVICSHTLFPIFRSPSSVFPSSVFRFPFSVFHFPFSSFRSTTTKHDETALDQPWKFNHEVQLPVYRSFHPIMIQQVEISRRQVFESKLLDRSTGLNLLEKYQGWRFVLFFFFFFRIYEERETRLDWKIISTRCWGMPATSEIIRRLITVFNYWDKWNVRVANYSGCSIEIEYFPLIFVSISIATQ